MCRECETIDGWCWHKGAPPPARWPPSSIIYRVLSGFAIWYYIALWLIPGWSISIMSSVLFFFSVGLSASPHPPPPSISLPPPRPPPRTLPPTTHTVQPTEQIKTRDRENKWIYYTTREDTINCKKIYEPPRIAAPDGTRSENTWGGGASLSF